MSAADRVRDVVAPLVDAAGLRLYDLELAGGVLRVLVDRDGGADIDAISRLTRAVSHALDEHDPIAGSYTLEVSTPGLERPLRVPSHYIAAIGTTVKVKTRPGVEGERRVEGTITAADDDTVTVVATDGAARTLRYDDIERARTTFEWGPTPKHERKAKA
jgi:ribosome maturation factor RimP